jgi:hypothetical protein
LPTPPSGTGWIVAGSGAGNGDGIGGGSALACAQAAIGDAIQSKDSIPSGAFMAFPGVRRVVAFEGNVAIRKWRPD